MGSKTAEQPKKKKGGCLGMLKTLLFLVLMVLVAGVYFAFDPQDLSDLQGYRKDESVMPGKVRNLEFVLKSAHRNNTGATITEKELNDYLGRTLKMNQGGLFKDYVTLRGVWVRLQDGWAEVILEREIAYGAFKRRHTIAMHLEIVQLMGENGQITTGINPAGHDSGLVKRLTTPNAGRFGRVPIVEGYLHMVNASYEKLISLYPEEAKVFTEMFESGTRVTIEKGQLVIKPAPEDLVS